MQEYKPSMTLLIKNMILNCGLISIPAFRKGFLLIAEVLLMLKYEQHLTLNVDSDYML